MQGKGLSIPDISDITVYNLSNYDTVKWSYFCIVGTASRKETRLKSFERVYGMMFFERRPYIDCVNCYIYSDAAYLLRLWILRPFMNRKCLPDEAVCNAAMSAVRASVEHCYRDIKQLWTSHDYLCNLKVRQAPVALLCKAAVLLANMRVCLYNCGQVNN